jgi:hypothetical protein
VVAVGAANYRFGVGNVRLRNSPPQTHREPRDRTPRLLKQYGTAREQVIKVVVESRLLFATVLPAR